MLQKVYKEFDLGGDGSVGAEEMLALGQARRRLGQKQGEWTREMNQNMMGNMGADSEGNVSMSNFVSYFNEKLSSDQKQFDKEIQQFIDCARSLAKKKSDTAKR